MGICAHGYYLPPHARRTVWCFGCSSGCLDRARAHACRLAQKLITTSSSSARAFDSAPEHFHQEHLALSHHPEETHGAELELLELAPANCATNRHADEQDGHPAARTCRPAMRTRTLPEPLDRL